MGQAQPCDCSQPPRDTGLTKTLGLFVDIGADTLVCLRWRDEQFSC